MLVELSWVDLTEARSGTLFFACRTPSLSFPPSAFLAALFRSWEVTLNPVFGLIGCRMEWLAKIEKLRPVAMQNKHLHHSNAEK